MVSEFDYVYTLVLFYKGFAYGVVGFIVVSEGQPYT